MELFTEHKHPRAKDEHILPSHVVKAFEEGSLEDGEQQQQNEEGRYFLFGVDITLEERLRLFVAADQKGTVDASY